MAEHNKSDLFKLIHIFYELKYRTISLFTVMLGGEIVQVNCTQNIYKFEYKIIIN